MKGLGKGLDALLGGKSSSGDSSKVQTVSIYQIDNNSEQPRKIFNEEKLLELAESIEQHGVVQPIIVRQNGERFTIIAGERRFRAARLAGLNEVPVLIRELGEQETLEVSLIENLQRENLNALEEARAIRQLMDEHDLTQEAVAKRLGKSRPAVANAVRLLALPEQVQQLLFDGRLQAGHCRALASIPDEAKLMKLAKAAADEEWSVRETEQRVKAALEKTVQPTRAAKPETLSSDARAARDALRERLGTKVDLTGSDERGRIVIEFFSKDELMSIFDTIMGKTAEDGK